MTKSHITEAGFTMGTNNHHPDEDKVQEGPVEKKDASADAKEEAGFFAAKVGRPKTAPSSPPHNRAQSLKSKLRLSPVNTAGSPWHSLITETESDHADRKTIMHDKMDVNQLEKVFHDVVEKKGEHISLVYNGLHEFQTQEATYLNNKSDPAAAYIQTSVHRMLNHVNNDRYQLYDWATMLIYEPALDRGETIKNPVPQPETPEDAKKHYDEMSFKPHDTGLLERPHHVSFTQYQRFLHLEQKRVAQMQGVFDALKTRLDDMNKTQPNHEAAELLNALEYFHENNKHHVAYVAKEKSLFEAKFREEPRAFSHQEALRLTRAASEPVNSSPNFHI